MKYILLVLAFLTTSSFACSTDRKSNELPAFAKVIQSFNTDSRVGIGVFVPSSVEDADAETLTVNFFEGESLLLSTSIALQISEGVEDLLDEADLTGYSVGFLSANKSVLENISLEAHYRFRPKEGGGMIMCGPIRHFKLLEIMKEA